MQVLGPIRWNVADCLQTESLPRIENVGARLQELYERYPSIAERFQSQYSLGWESVLDGLYSERVPIGGSFQELHEFSRSGMHREIEWIARGLVELPVDVIVSEFGEDAVLWLATNTLFRGMSRDPFLQFFRKQGYDPETLTTAVRAAEKYCDRTEESLRKCVEDSYSLFRAVKKGELLPPDQIGFMNKFLQVSALVHRAPDEYKVIPVCTDKESLYGLPVGWDQYITYQKGNEKAYQVYLDAPIGFALMHNEVPQAVVSFFRKRVDELLIVQFQGVRPSYQNQEAPFEIRRGHSPGLAGIDWRACMVALVEEGARACGFRRIGIRSAENNPWTQDSLGAQKKPYSLEAAERNYDDTARRIGYRRERDGNFYKELTRQPEKIL